jgi:hypothetical protein
MTRKRMAVAGVAGLTWLGVACSGGNSPPPASTGGSGGAATVAATDTSAQSLADSLREYLSSPAAKRMYQWEEAISKAVCNIEKWAPGIPPGGDRYCPGKGQWPPSGTPPPKFPPN